MRYDSLHHQAGVEGFLSGYGSPGRARVHAAGHVVAPVFKSGSWTAGVNGQPAKVNWHWSVA
jgi:hypothetical protein